MNEERSIILILAVEYVQALVVSVLVHDAGSQNMYSVQYVCDTTDTVHLGHYLVSNTPGSWR